HLVTKGLAGPSFRVSLKTPGKGNQFGVSPDLTRGYWSSASHKEDLSIPTGAFRVPSVQSTQSRVRCGSKKMTGNLRRAIASQGGSMDFRRAKVSSSSQETQG